MSSATINGRSELLPSDPDALLVDVLRDTLRLTGTKLVCGAGVCGACTVMLDGVPVVSCLLPAHAAAGKSVTTVEGIGVEALHPVQKAFMALDALQCGFCTPGFIVEATAFHDNWRAQHGAIAPSREIIGEAMSGHLCRCSAYDNIFSAIGEACAGRFDGIVEASPRVEARAKVTGAAKYTVDVKHPNQLEGLIVRSKLAHARITSLDLAPALSTPGVAAAISLIDDDNHVRFVGQKIAAIAAVDLKTARAAAAAIIITYDPLPIVIGADAARQETAPHVLTGKMGPANAAEGPLMPARWRRNVRGPNVAFSTQRKKARAWIAEAREKRNPWLFEETFRTSVQQHTSLEPHAAVARFDGDQLTVHVSTQAVYELKKKIAKRFKINAEKVRVVAEHIGGGFGSKGVMGEETVTAIRLAQTAKAPVRVAFNRHEELSVAGYRPAAEIRVSLLPAADGTLKALSIRAQSDAGVAVNSTIAGLARLIYPAEAKELVDYDVVSHLPPGSPFRGPGGPPMAFALEQAIDEAAIRMRVDPIQLRKHWDPNANRQRLYDWAASLECWQQNARASEQTGRYRRGVGVATGYWLYLWQVGSKVELSLRGGRLIVSTAVQDIGTGIRTVIADTVAREFGIEPHEVDVRIGDSRLPEGPGSGGSRTTASVIPPLLTAIGKLKSSIKQDGKNTVIPGSNAPWRDLLAASPDLTITAERSEDDASRAGGQRSLIKDGGLVGSVFGWMMRRFSHMAVGAGAPSSVQVIEVEVDTLLGHVRVVKVHTGIAVGKIAAPALARGQAAGSVIQGLGYALYEAREVDARTGDILTAGLEDYRIPGIADTPPIDVHFDEGGFDHVLGGSVGIGEVATVPTAAALANAVRQAIGARPTEIPLRPDRVLALLRSKAHA